VQQTEQAVRPAPTVTIPPVKSPKPSVVRTVDRRVVLRQERLVSAWLRSLEVR
jgi:hypothetical protein